MLVKGAIGGQPADVLGEDIVGLMINVVNFLYVNLLNIWKGRNVIPCYLIHILWQSAVPMQSALELSNIHINPQSFGCFLPRSSDNPQIWDMGCLLRMITSEPYFACHCCTICKFMVCWTALYQDLSVWWWSHCQKISLCHVCCSYSFVSCSVLATFGSS